MTDSSAAVGASAPASSPDVSSSEVNVETPASPVPPKEPDFRSTKHKLKVNEKEHELDYENVIKLAQKGMASDEVFRNASAKEKKMADLLSRAKGGDLDWLESLAGEEQLSKWAEKRLLKIIERNEMSQEQRDLIDERKRREDAENKLKTREEQEADYRKQTLLTQASEDLDNQINSAFKTSGLPMTPSRLERVAQYMDASLNASGTLMDAGKALTRVNQEIRSDAAYLLESMSPEELKAFLPKKVLDAMRKADVEAVRSQNPLRNPTKTDGAVRKISDTKAKRMSTDQYFDQLEKKMKG